MKIFKKEIDLCVNCPNIRYQHFDGKGESSPYQYNWPLCNETKKPLSVPNENQGRTNIHCMYIPLWCPLEEIQI